MKISNVTRPALVAAMGEKATARFTGSNQVAFIVEDGESASASLTRILSESCGRPLDHAVVASAMRRFG